MPTIAVRLNREEVKAVLRALPAQASGRAADELGLVRDLHTTAGREGLAIIHEAYVVKSLGGTDAAGIKWPPRKRPDGRKAPQRTIWARHIPPARRVQVSPRPIGIRTGRLITSFAERTATADQVLELEPGAVRLGTRVPYAGYFAALRPIFPTGEWPLEWMQRLAGAIAGRLGVLLAEALSRK